MVGSSCNCNVSLFIAGSKLCRCVKKPTAYGGCLLKTQPSRVFSSLTTFEVNSALRFLLVDLFMHDPVNEQFIYSYFVSLWFTGDNAEPSSDV